MHTKSLNEKNLKRRDRRADTGIMTDLDPRFTFETFVVGPANRLASAAARRAAESPGASYNPLFVYSASGLGKTHILGAIAHHVSRHQPDKDVVYQTLEGFLGELTEALQGGDREGVKGRYGQLDILLMDDVQFLAGQSEAQEMLLRTLDSLTGEGKQVVLASDRPPVDIDGLDARLRSRFEGGLLVDIGSPEYETRVAILRKQADARGQALDPGVAEVIGRVPFKNIRELGGALNRILAIQELENRAVNPDEASSLLGLEAMEESLAGESDVGEFMDEISGTVAEQVQRQEAPWRKLLRETLEEAEVQGFKTTRLQRLMEEEEEPEGVVEAVERFKQVTGRLAEIKAELDSVGNPWPEAAHGVLRDPDRLEEAETLLASARERARPFPKLPPGPGLDGLAGKYPQLVVRAAEQLITTDRQEYNPLYVWSEEPGSAQDLLEAAGRSYLAEKDTARVAMVSVLEFAEEFIAALSSGVAGAWRERWWSAELLLVHGAADLSATERAQDEFFHLFEALQRRRAKIMVAADCPPAKIGKIDDRLRSRFEGGLVLEIEAGSERGRGQAPGAREEGMIPPLDQIVMDEDSREGFGPPSPKASEPEPSTEDEETERTRPKESEEVDVRALDREFIMAFTAGGGVQLGRDVSEKEAPDPTEASADDEEPEAPVAGDWFPSPERVIWEWPRPEERLVEEVD